MSQPRMQPDETRKFKGVEADRLRIMGPSLVLSELTKQLWNTGNPSSAILHLTSPLVCVAPTLFLLRTSEDSDPESCFLYHQLKLTMPPSSPFSARAAGIVESDSTFIISTFDAALPYLQSIGSQAQWGMVPFSQRPDWNEDTLAQIREATKSRSTGDRDGVRILVVERKVEDDADLNPGDLHYRISEAGQCFVSAAFAFFRENWIPPYITPDILPHRDDVYLDDIVYIEVMVTDSRAKDFSRGAGVFLIDHLRKYGRSKGKKALYLDGWAGNAGKLIRFVLITSGKKKKQY
ncbi:hypothetical protein SLS60_010971 [Paraconiothyrium brasiliense]|uniref:N-acetyltransferase domain-containing protein n=1 Tax=Paraconiothyrium brasiliense TaxID=300254 RepID=A0ABR3QMH9_9PLEO